MSPPSLMSHGLARASFLVRISLRSGTRRDNERGASEDADGGLLGNPFRVEFLSWATLLGNISCVVLYCLYCLHYYGNL